MSHDQYDETVDSRFGPPQPAVIWGVVMVLAVVGAGVTVWRAGGHATAADARLIASSDDQTLRQDVARLTAARDDLQGRLASIERGLGELKLASRSAAAPETTGSIPRPTPVQVEAVRSGFGVSLGPDSSLDAVRRRWTALSARHPQQLAKLSPRAFRSQDGAGVFDLVVGPFATRADADRSCAALAEQGVACDTTSYVGDPIGRP